MLKSKQDLTIGGNQNELRTLLESEMNALFKLTHHNVFRIQIQVFRLLFQFAKVTQQINKGSITEEQKDAEGNVIHSFADRFYRTLYELLLKVHMNKANSLDEYFGMVFKAIKNDQCVPRAIAFIKRLLQMSYINEANFTAASLLIISEVLKVRQDIRLKMFSFDL